MSHTVTLEVDDRFDFINNHWLAEKLAKWLDFQAYKTDVYLKDGVIKIDVLKEFSEVKVEGNAFSKLQKLAKSQNVSVEKLLEEGAKKYGILF